MEFTLIEIVGFAAYITNVVGNLLLTRKIITGWPVRLVSIVLWGIYAWNTASPSLLANACTFFALNCYGWFNWFRTSERRASDE